jgi:Domain of unknown function (DUF1905)
LERLSPDLSGLTEIMSRADSGPGLLHYRSARIGAPDLDEALRNREDEAAQSPQLEGPSTVDTIRFRAPIRYWNPEKASGLAVADIPAQHVAALGGLKQQRVRGRIGGAEFASSVMPAGGGRLALSVSRAMMASASAAVGDDVDVEISGVGREP